MEQQNQGAGGNVGTTPNLNPSPAAATAGKPRTFKPRMFKPDGARVALTATVMAVAGKPRTDGSEGERQRNGKPREPKPDSRYRSKNRGGNGKPRGGQPHGGGSAVRMGEGWRRAESVARPIVAEAAQEAPVAEARAETQAEAEERLGRKVASRGSGRLDRAEDIKFWKDLFSGAQDLPASSATECGLHEDCGNVDLAHIVVTTLKLRSPHVITVCWMGKESFDQTVKELNKTAAKPRRYSFFGKLEDAEAKAMALTVQWGIGRRVGGGKKSASTTSADELKERASFRRLGEGSAERQGQVDPYCTKWWNWVDALYARVWNGAERPHRPSGNPQPQLKPSPYLIRTVLAENAARKKSDVFQTSGGRRITLTDIRRANERLRTARKQLTAERRQALKAGKLARLDKLTPATQNMIARREQHLRSLKFRKLALRGWQIRRGEQVTVAVTPATLARPASEKTGGSKKHRKPTRRGHYIATNRRPRENKPREINVGFTVHNALTVRGQMLAAMGYSGEAPRRGEAAAGTGRPKEQ